MPETNLPVCEFCTNNVAAPCVARSQADRCSQMAGRVGLSAVADALSAPAVAPSNDTPVPSMVPPVAPDPALSALVSKAQQAHAATWGAEQKPTEVQIGGDHYKRMAIQPLTYIQANEIGFEVGNIIKYVSRYKNKGGTQDLEKARDMLDKLIAFEVAKEKQGLMEYLSGLFQSV